MLTTPIRISTISTSSTTTTIPMVRLTPVAYPALMSDTPEPVLPEPEGDPEPEPEPAE